MRTSGHVWQVVLNLVGLAVAWTTFRITRDATARRDVSAAMGLLTAVRAGIVEHDGEPGWGEAYLGNIYTDAGALERSALAVHGVERGTLDQVFVVPTEPLQLLATALPQPGSISVETVSAANVALWRLKVFNQLVAQQTAFNALHAAELTNPATSDERRRTLAEAARAISFSVHRHGIGAADAPGGWYRALKGALSRDIERLERLDRRRWWRRAARERFFFVVDVVAWGGVLAALAVATFG